MSEKFSVYLSKYRDEHGLTQEELADRMGVKVRMVQLYLSGEYDGSPQKVKKYKDRLAENLQAGKSASNTQVFPRNVAELIELYKKVIAALERELAVKDKYIALLESRVK